LGIEMIDYAEHALRIKKLEKEIHNLVLKRKYQEAESLAGELLIDVRQLWIWLIHAQESINESNSNVRL
jgi:hypothetical protein